MNTRNCKTRKALSKTLFFRIYGVNFLLMEQMGERTEGTAIGIKLAKMVIGRRKGYVFNVKLTYKSSYIIFSSNAKLWI